MAIRSSRESAYLISNAQVTASAGRTIRRPRRRVLVHMRNLVVAGDAVQTGRLRATRPVHGSCVSPVQVTEVGGSHDRPMLDTFVRCRKCPPCLQFKRAMWSARAHHEITMHRRSWMVTLTCSPTEHFRLLNRARHLATVAGYCPEKWSPAEEFSERWKQMASEVTKWLKRLRAKGARFNYLLVVEAHKSGLPHVHLLIHEVSDCTYRTLTESWSLGFSHAKLVEGPNAARYVTKYLMKSAMARVRASQRYGSTTLEEPRARARGIYPASPNEMQEALTCQEYQSERTHPRLQEPLLGVPCPPPPRGC